MPMNPAEAMKKTPTMVLPAEMSGVSKLNLNPCAECKLLEYACTCDH